MSSRYVDITSIMQVIGTVYKNPEILEQEDKYPINEEDFEDMFHKVIFGTIYNLYHNGAKSINLTTIEDYLSSRESSYGIFHKNKGEEWLLTVEKNSNLLSFDYYYNRLKKMTLLRMFDYHGIDVTDIYDPTNLLDLSKKKKQEDFLDNTSLEQIADIVDDKITKIRLKYVNDDYSESSQAGDGILELIQNFKTNPEVGLPLYGSLINTVTMGARLKKFYLRSGSSGAGKTRAMVADVCFLGADEIYYDGIGWVKNGVKQPALFIATEQDLTEVQTMMLAFLSNVNELKILQGKYEGDEEERVIKAAQVIIDSPIFVEQMPDFSLRDVETRIKRNILDHDVRYVAFDYIHSSMKILEEITKRSGGVRLREDNILFMLSTKLKEICNVYGIFLISGTQLSGDWKDSDSPDQNLLRGAKSIADRVDLGSILLNTTPKDIESLDAILSTGVFDKPNIKLSVYKNRRGPYKGVYLWCKADLGTCRINPMFMTTWNYEMIEIEDLKIEIAEEESAFMEE